MMTGVVPKVPQYVMRFMLNAPVVPAPDDVVTSSESAKGIDGIDLNCNVEALLLTVICCYISRGVFGMKLMFPSCDTSRAIAHALWCL